MLSKCVFCRPEHTANGGPLKLNFEGLGIERWNIPTDRAQRVGEKYMFICLVIMFTPRVIFIKCQIMTLLYFLLTIAKN